MFQAMGKLYLSILSLFSASSAGVLSPQKKSPPTTMLLPASPAKAPETEPIDVAAHLQLLGESLSLIGHRLQETEVSETMSIAPVSDTMWVHFLLPCEPSQQLLLFCVRLCQVLRIQWQRRYMLVKTPRDWESTGSRSLHLPPPIEQWHKQKLGYPIIFPPNFYWDTIVIVSISSCNSFWLFKKCNGKKWIQIPWKFWSFVLLREFAFFCTFPARS